MVGVEVSETMSCRSLVCASQLIVSYHTFCLCILWIDVQSFGTHKVRFYTGFRNQTHSDSTSMQVLRPRQGGVAGLMCGLGTQNSGCCFIYHHFWDHIQQCISTFFWTCSFSCWGNLGLKFVTNGLTRKLQVAYNWQHYLNWHGFEFPPRTDEQHFLSSHTLLLQNGTCAFFVCSENRTCVLMKNLCTILEINTDYNWNDVL